MERSHADCSWNILGYINQCRGLRFDRYVDLKCHFSPERHNQSNDLSKSITIYMEWSHTDGNSDRLAYINQCRRLGFDRYVNLKCHFSSERHDHSNDLSKSITIHLEWSHADCSWNILGYINQCRRLRFDRYIDLKCYFSSERHNHSNHLSKSIAIHLEWSYAECSWNILGYINQCRRL